MTQLSTRELNVLNILWKIGEPMTSNDIVNEQKGLTQSTVMAVLRKLLKDSLVEIDGVTRSGKVLSRTFCPTRRSKEVIMDNFLSDYTKFKNIISKSDLCAAILNIEQDPEQMKSEIYKLRNIVADYEKKIN